jgi:hypothetical protein
VPADFVMNAISVSEVGYLLETAKSKKIVPPKGEIIAIKDISMAILFDFMVPHNDIVCSKDGVEALYANMRGAKRYVDIGDISHFDILFSP